MLADVISQTESSYILDIYLYTKDKLTSDAMLQPGDPKKGDGRLGPVPVLLSPSTVSAISTIQLNLPTHHRDAESPKVVEAMFMELMRRFDYGAKFNTLHPVEEMEIEFDE